MPAALTARFLRAGRSHQLQLLSRLRPTNIYLLYLRGIEFDRHRWPPVHGKGYSLRHWNLHLPLRAHTNAAKQSPGPLVQLQSMLALFSCLSACERSNLVLATGAAHCATVYNAVVHCDGIFFRPPMSFAPPFGATPAPVSC
ncbi:hypothetical protein LX32DRAFT_646302 [Colletotrichum zoysiae]|uniref:Uncharacterized protein n=1 Tax=Colletotrichum zoysiae TaxID=1216348 RepID=A0AAD9LV48_9PEZI|nr:hypothetical protein LX32DRAFT_646302 [Colletotrichum zoysiae]